MSRPSAAVRKPAPVSAPPPGSGRGPDRRPQPGGWAGFVRRYGWRAYALPILAVVTVLAAFTTHSRGGRTPAGAAALNSSLSPSASASSSSVPSPRASQSTPVASRSVAVPASSAPAAKPANALALPAGPAYTQRGTGTFATIPGTSPVIGKGTVHSFSIEVENGITGVDLKAYAATVMSALSNVQSWAGADGVALRRVDSGAVDFHVTLTSSLTVRQLCGYSIPVETSCYDSSQGRVVLNVARWVRGAALYSGQLATYRIYAVNHEVGHALGHNHAHDCLANGMAPVMMQQTIGAKTASGQTCVANPWPYPHGVSDAPGAEQPGDAADSDFFARNS